MPALDGMTGIVLGAIFGSVFVLTCIISAIKAVRDRSRIKKRRAEKKREKLENGYADGKKESAIEETQGASSYTQQKTQPSNSGGNRCSNGSSVTRNSMEHLDLSVYSIEAGIDNLNFKHSNNEMNYADEIRRASSQTSKTTAEIVPSRHNMAPKRARSSDANFRQEKNLDHLPTHCLAIQKSIRRHSYEVAVCENSWLPMEPPCFATSQTILNAYSFGGSPENVKSSRTAFENKAYDKDDYKKT